MAVYAALVACIIPFHEPWGDEAQAWLMARDLPIWQLLHTFIRYEGQPAVWHVLLWAATRLHVTYAGMHWLCGLAGICATWLLLFNSPFPRWLKFSLPFTYFLAYQYVIVARSYVLLPFLLFCAALSWKRNPIVLALVLGIIANTAAHGAAIAAGFGVAYCIERTQRLRARQPAASSNQFRTAVFLLLGMALIAILVAFPTSDVSFLSSPVVRMHSGTNKALRGFAALIWATWQPWPVALVGWPLVIAGLIRRRALHMALPMLTLLLFLTVVYLTFWHAGLMVLVLIAVLWITWPATDARSIEETLMRCAIAALVATQIGWTIYAAWYDHFRDYSPDLRTAQYLAPAVHAGISIASDGEIGAANLAGIQPYFGRNIFINQPYSFWFWSRSVPARPDYSQCPDHCPQIVVFEASPDENGGPPVATGDSAASGPKPLREIEAHGYRLDRAFCGGPPANFQVTNFRCYYILSLKTRELTSANTTGNAASPSTLSR